MEGKTYYKVGQQISEVGMSNNWNLDLHFIGTVVSVELLSSQIEEGKTSDEYYEYHKELVTLHSGESFTYEVETQGNTNYISRQ